MIPEVLDQLIQENTRILVNLEKELVPSVYEQSDRTCLGVPLLRHAHTLACSIGFLLKHQHVAAGFTLFRPLFEGYARGIWALRCGDDKELKRAQKDNFPKLYEVIASIKSRAVDSSDWFDEVYTENKKSLNSLTHGGIQMILLLYEDGTEKVEPDYPVDEQIRFMHIVQEITLGAGEELRKHLRREV